MNSERAWVQIGVAAVGQEALDINSFELAAANGGSLPPFDAGSHIDVRTPTGLVRQYSLFHGGARQGRYKIAVLKAGRGRGGSLSMHALSEGAKLRIGAPLNHFKLERAAAHSVLVAGGIGVTPLIAMAEHLQGAGRSFEFHYSVRSRERAAFAEYLARLIPASQMHLYDTSAGERPNFKALMTRGRSDAHIYYCGPASFMDAVAAAGAECEVSNERLHKEYFAGAQAAPEPAGELAFEVVVASTGLRCEVASGESVTEALRKVGLEIQTSCEQGVCGTCLTRILKGVPDHRDLYLSDSEKRVKDVFLPCCSRAVTRELVLDL